jgi:hypothetical protein
MYVNARVVCWAFSDTKPRPVSKNDRSLCTIGRRITRCCPSYQGIVVSDLFVAFISLIVAAATTGWIVIGSMNIGLLTVCGGAVANFHSDSLWLEPLVGAVLYCMVLCWCLWSVGVFDSCGGPIVSPANRCKRTYMIRPTAALHKLPGRSDVTNNRGKKMLRCHLESTTRSFIQIKVFFF